MSVIYPKTVIINQISPHIYVDEDGRNIYRHTNCTCGTCKDKIEELRILRKQNKKLIENSWALLSGYLGTEEARNNHYKLMEEIEGVKYSQTDRRTLKRKDENS